MLDKPKHDLIESKSRELAGERFSADKQCELIFGPGSNVCPFTVTVSMQGRKVESVSGMARKLHKYPIISIIRLNLMHAIFAQNSLNLQ